MKRDVVTAAFWKHSSVLFSFNIRNLETHDVGNDPEHRVKRSVAASFPGLHCKSLGRCEGMEIK